MTLTAEQRTKIQWVIDYMEKGGAPGHIDQTVSDQLASIFKTECGFVCGCPGSFAEGLHDTPITTLLRVILCVDEG
jgi:hypothetical protein